MRTVERRRVPADQWDAFVEAHEHGWFYHTSRWLAYALAYTPGAVDRSHALVDDDHALLAVVPTVLDPSGRAVYGGQPVAAPVAAPDVDYGITKLTRPVVVVGRPGQDEPDDVVGGTAASWPTYVVDLRRPEPELWRGLRKSYRGLIRRAGRERYVAVYGHANAASAVGVARLVHVAAAGRETRPPETWDHMARWVADGDALVSVASAPERTPLGFAYALRWKSWAYYFSGAALEDDLQHALVWELIRALRCDGRTTHFEVGWGHREADTEKDCGIHHFKAGFGGEAWPVHAVERRA